MLTFTREKPPVAGDYTELVTRLEKRLGRRYARQRLGIEREHEAQIFGQGLNFFHIQNLPLSHSLIRGALLATGLYRRGIKNAANVELRHVRFSFPTLPRIFDGFTILHLSDLHADLCPPATRRVAELVSDLDYDVCVITGDFRGPTCGPFVETLQETTRVIKQLKAPVYAVLGNHDTILMVPELEEMGIKMLLNESVAIERTGTRIHIAGVDDAHFYRMDNIEKASQTIPHKEFSVLISHTPEIYKQAAHAGFNLLFAGHTHGGQICLPGGFPITLDSVLPRSMGAGRWQHQDMAGYTSVGAGCSIVPVRFNCRPEITLHHLHRSS
jgi:predicted MPP superfamily phosphohydrolase